MNTERERQVQNIHSTEKYGMPWKLLMACFSSFKKNICISFDYQRSVLKKTPSALSPCSSVCAGGTKLKIDV